MNVDELIFKIVGFRDQIAELNKEVDEIKAERAKVEAELMQAMREMNVTQLGSVHGTASIKKQQTPIVVDWDTVNTFILENNMLGLLQRRLSTKFYDELVNDGQSVPGVDVFEQDTVSIRRK